MSEKSTNKFIIALKKDDLQKNKKKIRREILKEKISNISGIKQLLKEELNQTFQQLINLDKMDCFHVTLTGPSNLKNMGKLKDMEVFNSQDFLREKMTEEPKKNQVFEEKKSAESIQPKKMNIEQKKIERPHSTQESSHKVLLTESSLSQSVQESRDLKNFRKGSDLGINQFCRNGDELEISPMSGSELKDYLLEWKGRPLAWPINKFFAVLVKVLPVRLSKVEQDFVHPFRVYKGKEIDLEKGFKYKDYGTFGRLTYGTIKTTELVQKRYYILLIRPLNQTKTASGADFICEAAYDLSSEWAILLENPETLKKIKENNDRITKEEPLFSECHWAKREAAKAQFEGDQLRKQFKPSFQNIIGNENDESSRDNNLSTQASTHSNSFENFPGLNQEKFNSSQSPNLRLNKYIGASQDYQKTLNGFKLINPQNFIGSYGFPPKLASRGAGNTGY